MVITIIIFMIIIIEIVNSSKVIVHNYLQEIIYVDEGNNNLKVCSEKTLSKNPYHT